MPRKLLAKKLCHLLERNVCPAEVKPKRVLTRDANTSRYFDRAAVMNGQRNSNYWTHGSANIAN